MDKKILLKIKDIKKYFPIKKVNMFQKGTLYIKAIDGISLDIYEGETLGLVGESGCGKSTLGRILLKLYPQTEGTVMYYGRTLQEVQPHYMKHANQEALGDGGIDLSRLSHSEMRVLRKDLQMIFQDPYSSLNPRMSAGQIISESLAAHDIFKKNREGMEQFVQQVMEECGLAPYMMQRYPHQFSGGQRQRIGLARALALRPKFVVCDEPVSALDVSIQSQIINLLQDLKKQLNLTYLFISHDLSVVKCISDRIGVMYLGNIVELANTEELFASPLHPYTQALLCAIPSTDVDADREIVLLEGDIPSPMNPPSGCKFHTRCRYATEVCRTLPPTLEEASPGHFTACHNKNNLVDNESEGD